MINTMASNVTMGLKAEPSFQEYVDTASTFFISPKLIAPRLMGAGTVELYVGPTKKCIQGP